jgi:Cu-Zn family superoxide dismutase
MIAPVAFDGQSAGPAVPSARVARESGAIHPAHGDERGAERRAIAGRPYRWSSRIWAMPTAPDRASVAPRWTWRRAAVAVLLSLAVTSGCRIPYIPPFTKPPLSAIADLADVSGRVLGKAVMIEESDGVRIIVDFVGVTPGTKAVHIHENGRCEPPSFESAGAHFNPAKTEHGTSNPRGPHAGDLPNVVVDSTGRGHLEATAKKVMLGKGASSLLSSNGTALVLHEGADDLRTNPDGKSGARIACGIIRGAG